MKYQRMMARVFLFVAGVMASFWVSAQQECVILVHGLFRTSLSMTRLESSLEKQNYVVINKNYPSTRKSIQEIADTDIAAMVNECLRYHPTHIDFVTHSMGGRIVGAYVQTHPNPKIHRIVMMGPPNHGSIWVDKLHQTKVLRFILGPAIEQLSTHTPLQHLKNKTYQIGIIAGDFCMNPLNYLLFHEPNDGKVAVSSTKLAQMDDFIVMPVTHTFMMRNRAVERQILSFIKDGHFIHKSTV